MSRKSPNQLYELHTFIFPPTKPKAGTMVPRYCFPISSTLAQEFLTSQAYKRSFTPSPAEVAAATQETCQHHQQQQQHDQATDWVSQLARHPEYVISTISHFVDTLHAMRWRVAGMRFVDEEEERERRRKELEGERERRRKERQRQREEEAIRLGRVVFYGGVYYGYWYGQGDEGDELIECQLGMAGKGSWGGSLGLGWSGYMTGNAAGYAGRKGELKCQILMVREA
ncbi:hypothetical protein BDZ91DRAFT_371383 [Kalaharituber pfeilii]|nr:hypothetical protein BDZ91DRAFT_371383 [Kalaharituber pfeilii]